VSHRDRMREAVIEFLRGEQESERQASASSFSNSLDLGESMSPDHLSGLEMEREQIELSDSVVEEWKTMSTVWSSKSGLKQRSRWRRTMNEEERRDYRKRRAAGACGLCRRKKRKCLHENGDEVSNRMDGYEGDRSVTSLMHLVGLWGI